MMSERIAHALGCINGIKYTNSMAAFTKSYSLGRRTFEVDIELFSDNQMVCFHNQKEDNSGFRLNKESSLVSSKTALNYQFFLPDGETVTPLSIKDLSELIRTYKDCRFIIDIKGVKRKSKGWRKVAAKALTFLPSLTRIQIYKLLYKYKTYLATGLESNLTFRNIIQNFPKDALPRIFLQVNLDNYFIFSNTNINFVWRKKRRPWLKIDPKDASSLNVEYYSVHIKDLNPGLLKSCEKYGIQILVYGHRLEDEHLLLEKGFSVFSDSES